LPLHQLLVLKQLLLVLKQLKPQQTGRRDLAKRGGLGNTVGLRRVAMQES